MIVQPSDGPIIILIDCEQFSETVACWLSLRAYQTVNKDLDFLSYKKIKKIIIQNNFERHFARNCVKKMDFYFQINSVKNNLKCPKPKSH